MTLSRFSAYSGMRRIQVFLLLGIFALVFAEDNPCTVHADGKYYNLNNLKARWALLNSH